jgi:hypothetical protein
MRLGRKEGCERVLRWEMNGDGRRHDPWPSGSPFGSYVCPLLGGMSCITWVWASSKIIAVIKWEKTGGRILVLASLGGHVTPPLKTGTKSKKLHVSLYQTFQLL